MDKYRIDVVVEPVYLEEQSDVAADVYAFGYRVRMVNRGSVPVRLESRHWVIVDANGRVQEVRGPGVVGEHPHMAPGHGFEYTSWVRLETPYGSMEGSYRMRADDGTEFDASIPRFELVAPRVLH